MVLTTRKRKVSNINWKSTYLRHGARNFHNPFNNPVKWAFKYKFYNKEI